MIRETAKANTAGIRGRSVKDLISQKYSNITVVGKVDYHGRKLNGATTL